MTGEAPKAGISGGQENKAKITATLTDDLGQVSCETFKLKFKG